MEKSVNIEIKMPRICNRQSERQFYSRKVFQTLHRFVPFLDSMNTPFNHRIARDLI